MQPEQNGTYPSHEPPPGRGGGVARRWVWGAVALALLAGGYLWAGFTLVPGLIRSQATGWVKINLNKPIALGEIRFNPIHFTVDVSDIAIPDSRQPMVAAGHLRLDFSILSLFQHAYRFKEVRLDAPFVRAIVRPDRSLNLIELVPKSRSAEPNPEVRIDSFSVNQGRIAFSDQSLPQRPEKMLAPITFALKDFHTNRAEGGAFTLNAESERREGFVWTGTLSIAPIASRGRLTVSNLQSDTIQKFLGAELPVVLTGGQSTFTLDYNFAYARSGLRLTAFVPNVLLSGLSFDGKKNLFNGTVKLDRLSANIGPVGLAAGNGAIARLNAAMPRLELHGLRVSPGAAEPGIELADVALKGASLDYGARKIDLGSLTLDGAALSVRRERDGKINLMTLLPQRPAASAATGTAPAPLWNFHLGALVLNAATVVFEDRAVSPAAKITAAAINASMTGIGSDFSQPVDVRFDARINGKASIGGEGAVTPADAAGDIKFTLANLPLPAFAAYMPRMPGLELRSGNAGAAGQLHFQGGDISALRFQGDASIDNFNLQEATTNSPLFAWQSFSLKAIDYRKDRAEIGRARLVRPLGRVAVLADRRFNFTSLMPAPAPAAAIPIQAARPTDRPAAKPALAFKVKRLDISRGTMGFADYSIQPNFEARIDELQGSVSNISNLTGEVATIDLKGQVIDRFSPVTIGGTMNLLGYDRRTDMHLAFRNIELPVFNPYSGRYAGYAIAKGKLTTELAYKIDNRALKADHHVIINQLEWGEATDSKDKVPLPIRLATALLKDKDGVIDLDVPVTGSLDDPKFRIGPIIWQIIGNILEKIVTAPFQMIGSLFAGAEKAQYVDFAPGSANLPAGSAQSLGELAKALAQRPELQLDIPAGPGIREDSVQLADTQIDAQLMAKESRNGAPADVAVLDIGEHHDRLQDLYRAKLGKRAAFPDFPPEALKAVTAPKPDLDDDERRTILEMQWLRAQLRTVYAPSSVQLTALGSARATAVRDALLMDGGIDPARVFMATAMTVTPMEGHSRLELKLK